MLEFKEQSSDIEKIVNSFLSGKDFKTKEWSFGTCHGQYFIRDKKLILLSIINEELHNGNFALCIEYFKNKAKEKHYDLVIGSIFNENLYNHFLKLGFEPIKKYNGLIKKWGQIK